MGSISSHLSHAGFPPGPRCDSRPHLVIPNLTHIQFYVTVRSGQLWGPQNDNSHEPDGPICCTEVGHKETSNPTISMIIMLQGKQPRWDHHWRSLTYLIYIHVCIHAYTAIDSSIQVLRYEIHGPEPAPNFNLFNASMQWTWSQIQIQ